MLSSFALIPYQAQIYPFITFYPPFTLSFLFYSYNDFVIQIYIMEVMILNFNQFENQNFLTVIQVIHLKI